VTTLVTPVNQTQAYILALMTVAAKLVRDHGWYFDSRP